MKPDWDDAPEWAEYLVSSFGSWAWFETSPKDNGGWRYGRCRTEGKSTEGVVVIERRPISHRRR